MLAVALESCLIQEYDPLEIIVGDDSPDERSYAVVESFRGRRSWQISYRHHNPGLGQNANVAELFQRATGGRLVLLHDDDVLLPGAIANLAEPWKAHPQLAVSFGNQQIIQADGTLDAPASDRLNSEFARAGSGGLLESSLRAALLQQMPNDGYMVRTDIARTIGYRTAAEIGAHCDLDFTLRLGAAVGDRRMFLVDRHVSQYRLTPGSISRSPANHRETHPKAAVALFATLESLTVPVALRREKRLLLGRFIESIVKGFAIMGKRANALRLFSSVEYGWRRRLSLRGLYHVLLIIDARWDRLRRYG